jgi:Na+(H+)/acetate symporter ActP
MTPRPLRQWTKRERAIVLMAVGAGLFLSHTLSEFVPDALGIGVGMFCTGFVGGMLASTWWSR